VTLALGSPEVGGVIYRPRVNTPASEQHLEWGGGGGWGEGGGQINWRANLEGYTLAGPQKQRDSSGTLIRLRYQKIGTAAHNGNKNSSWS
jgi:hypothetical protein